VRAQLNPKSKLKEKALAKPYIRSILEIFLNNVRHIKTPFTLETAHLECEVCRIGHFQVVQHLECEVFTPYS